jgi:hypothetical protein
MESKLWVWLWLHYRLSLRKTNWKRHGMKCSWCRDWGILRNTAVRIAMCQSIFEYNPSRRYMHCYGTCEHQCCSKSGLFTPEFPSPLSLCPAHQIAPSSDSASLPQGTVHIFRKRDGFEDQLIYRNESPWDPLHPLGKWAKRCNAQVTNGIIAVSDLMSSWQTLEQCYHLWCDAA